MNAKDRVKQILKDFCAGNASLATDILHAEFVIIHRDELPNTSEVDFGVSVEGVTHSVWAVTQATADRARKDAHEYLAVAEAIENALRTKASKDAARDKRREELAKELWPFTGCYGPLSSFARNAIDRIIDLEAACE